MLDSTIVGVKGSNNTVVVDDKDTFIKNVEKTINVTKVVSDSELEKIVKNQEKIIEKLDELLKSGNLFLVCN